MVKGFFLVDFEEKGGGVLLIWIDAIEFRLIGIKLPQIVE